MQFEVSCQLDADGVRTCRAIVEKLAAAPGHLQLDLSGVTNMDSSGLGLLVYLQKRKLQSGDRLEIRNVTGQPLSLLKRFDLLHVMGYQATASVAAAAVLEPLAEY
jgi:anti-anti-sigma factor